MDILADALQLSHKHCPVIEACGSRIADRKGSAPVGDLQSAVIPRQRRPNASRGRHHRVELHEHLGNDHRVELPRHRPVHHGVAWCMDRGRGVDGVNENIGIEKDHPAPDPCFAAARSS